MSYLREQDDYSDPQPDSLRSDDSLAHKDHELTLSSAAIFGIFFGQVVLCGIFFGFGYSMGGHRSTGPAETATAATPASSADFSGFKPAAGQPAGARAAVPVTPTAAANDDAGSSAPPARIEPVHIEPATTVPSSSTAPAARQPAPVVRATPAATVKPAAAATQGLWVQVAAISVTHPEDATLLQNALRAKGYSVSQHSGPDSFIHLLLGPYSDRAAADAMRQRLATDGYTAYIK